MNVFEIIQALEEVLALYQQLNEDGTIGKIQAAQSAVQTELSSNTNLQSLMSKVESLFTKKG